MGSLNKEVKKQVDEIDLDVPENVPDVVQPDSNLDLKESPIRTTAKPLSIGEREGVLKCKICLKYIKQSQMSDHKSSHESEEEVASAMELGPDLFTVTSNSITSRKDIAINQKIVEQPTGIEVKDSNLKHKDIDKKLLMLEKDVPADCINDEVTDSNQCQGSDLSSQENDTSTNDSKVDMTQNIDTEESRSLHKRKDYEAEGNESKLLERKAKRKTDSDDEWTEKSESKKKSFPCSKCRKKFGSKFGLTTHERMMHKKIKEVSTDPTQNKKNGENLERSIKGIESNLGGKSSPRLHSMAKIPKLKSVKILPVDKQSPSNLSASIASERSEVTMSSITKSSKITLSADSLPPKGLSSQLTAVGNSDGHAKPLSVSSPSTLLRSRANTSAVDASFTFSPVSVSTLAANPADVTSSRSTLSPQLKKLNSRVGEIIPLGTDTLFHAQSDESLLMESDEDSSKPLVINEDQVVTVQVGENACFMDLGDIDTEALLMTG